MGKIIVVTGIDTDIGKTEITGKLAKQYLDKGLKVITVKPIQTGCTGIAEDILRHRQIMQIEIREHDKNGLTNPYVFEKPASPHLSSTLENRKIDLEKIMHCINELSPLYDITIIEGAGGLFVPLTETQTFIDLAKMIDAPLFVITSPRLGSINHTMLTLDACKTHNLKVEKLIYNRFGNFDPQIEENSSQYFQKYCTQNSIDFISMM